MGYRGTMRVQDLFDEVPIRRVQRRVIGRLSEYARDRAAHHSPVAKIPEGITPQEFIKGRDRRRPATLRNSWRIGRVRTLPDGTLTVDVYSTDRIAPLVEDNTQPHLITPKNGRVLAFPHNGRIVFATIVHHPGTTGQHMLKIAFHEARAELHRIGREELEQWARRRYDHPGTWDDVAPR